MFDRSFLLRAVLASLASCLAVSAARAQTVITSLPYTITAGGLYVLGSNLSSTQTSGNLIEIDASNVTLDLQGHYLAGPVGNTTQNTVGIYARERSNVTVQNGTVAYCLVGVSIDGNNTATTNAVDEVIDSLRVTYCYAIGINVDFAPSSRITNCQVSQIGDPTTSGNVGINIDGAGVTVQGNTVSNILGGSGDDTYCIFAYPGSFVRSNQVASALYGIELGLYQNNLADACTYPFSDGTDCGGNAND